jgi:hypothetical protein
LHRLAGIEIENGDDVGVATAWYFPGQGSAEAEVADKAADHVFIQILTRFNLEGRSTSSSAGGGYAPNLFSKEPEAKMAKVGKAALADAMRRLFVAKKIRVEQEGAGGKRRSRLVVVP